MDNGPLRCVTCDCAGPQFYAVQGDFTDGFTVENISGYVCADCVEMFDVDAGRLFDLLAEAV